MKHAMWHVAAIPQETLCAFVEHIITHFEHVIDPNRVHIEQML